MEILTEGSNISNITTGSFFLVVSMLFDFWSEESEFFTGVLEDRLAGTGNLLTALVTLLPISFNTITGLGSTGASWTLVLFGKWPVGFCTGSWGLVSCWCCSSVLSFDKEEDEFRGRLLCRSRGSVGFCDKVWEAWCAYWWGRTLSAAVACAGLATEKETLPGYRI